MKTIIEMAREAGWTEAGKPQTGYEGYHAEFVENIIRFADLVKAARDAELLEGVEMPELLKEDSQEANDAIRAMLVEYSCPANPQNAGRAGWRAARQHFADQLRSTVAAAVLREREACAEACEETHDLFVASMPNRANAWDCAAAIRNRSKA